MPAGNTLRPGSTGLDRVRGDQSDTHAIPSDATPDLGFLGGSRDGSEASYPRAVITLSGSVRNVERDWRTNCFPTHATFTRRSRTKAGEFEVRVLGANLPFNPAVIDGLHVVLMMGDAPSVGASIQQPRNVRAQGYIDQIEEERNEDGQEVILRGRDYSTIFRDFRPLPSDSVPLYSDSLSQALGKIIDAVAEPFVRRNVDFPVVLRSLEEDPPLSAAVHARGQTGPIPLDPKGSAWDHMERVCGIVSKHLHVELDELVVTDPLHSYKKIPESKFNFVFGEHKPLNDANLLSVSRMKKFNRNRRTVKCVTYDATTRTVLEAQFPPPGRELNLHTPPATGFAFQNQAPRRQVRHRRSTQPRVVHEDKEVELIDAPNGIADETQLRKYVAAVWLERSRGELEGRLVTPRFDHDILNLWHADRITIQVDPGRDAATLEGSEQQAVQTLAMRYGMDVQTARVLVGAVRQLPSAQYHVRAVTGTFDAEGESSVEVEFMSLLDISDVSAEEITALQQAAGL